MCVCSAESWRPHIHWVLVHHRMVMVMLAGVRQDCYFARQAHARAHYVHCDGDAQARKQAQAIEASLRLERLSQQAGSSMVTTKSYASMDEEGLESEAVLQRLNIILKARPLAHGVMRIA